jgi:hypothetical protein
MTLFSTKDDFIRTTLTTIPGILGKLDYLSSLRAASGEYLHWGLARVHGDESAQQAIAEAHRLLFLQALRTPLRQLLEDAAQATAAQQWGVQKFLEDLARRGQELLPGHCGGGSIRHFSSVVSALLSLARQRPGATRLDA